MLWKNPEFDVVVVVVVSELPKQPHFSRIFLWTPKRSGSLREAAARGTCSNAGWVICRRRRSRLAERFYLFIYFICNKKQLWDKVDDLNGGFRAARRLNAQWPARRLRPSTSRTPETLWTSKWRETPTSWTLEVEFCFKYCGFNFLSIFWNYYQYVVLISWKIESLVCCVG